MKKKPSLFTPFRLSLLLIFCDLSVSISVNAQERRNAQVGEINIENTKDQGSPYQKAQEETLLYFENFSKVLREQNGSLEKTGTLTDNQLNYLNGVYLYCTVNTGTCPAVLESLYEIDLINSKISGIVACPILTQFWKLWLRSEMEKRQGFLVKTSYITATSEFTNKIRPRFVKCIDSVKTDLENSAAADTFFKERYVPQSKPIQAVEKTIQILKTLKDRSINVFVATGSVPVSTNDPETPLKKK